MSFSLFASASDDGHVLTSLWKKYDEAAKADRPQKEAELLQQIRDEAMLKRLPVDFYDAGKEYVNTVRRRNWKAYSAAENEWSELVQKFNEPIVTYTWMKDFGSSSVYDRREYVLSHLSQFKGLNRPFHRDVSFYMGGELEGGIQSDREYVLWDLLARQYSYDLENNPVYQQLQKELDGRYPDASYLEFYGIQSKSEPVVRDLLRGFIEKYNGRGISFWARESLLLKEYHDLKVDKNTEEDYKAIYEKCQQFEKDRKRLTGQEARVAKGCDDIQDVMETLTAKNLWVRLKGRTIEVEMQNIDDATVTLESGRKTVLKWTAENPGRRFYLSDTARIELPAIPDGDYTIRAKKGKLENFVEYEQYTLSVATRQDARGLSIYVADYKSGEPLPTAHVTLLYAGKEVVSTDMKLNGFTLLPDAFQSAFKQHTYYDITVTKGDRKSRELSFSRESWSADNTYRDGTYCHLYRDRGAYNPGDTVRFKAVVCRGNLVDRIAVVPDMALEAVLTNAESKEVGRLKLTTNAFGSVSGAFPLPVDQRNGSFTLKILSEGKSMVSETFPVDEFILPTYTLEFEKVEKLCLPEEEATVRGKVRSYSGHSLTGARLDVTVERYGTLIHEESLTPGKDGSFEIKFCPKTTGYYRVHVRVVDATGETAEYSTGVYVANAIRVSGSVRNGRDGEFSVAGEKENNARYGRWGMGHYVVDTDTAQVLLEVRNSDGQKVPLPVYWTLLDREGKSVSEGKVDSGTVLALKLPQTGLYVLQFRSEVPDTKIEDKAELMILRLDENDKLLPGPFSYVHLSGPLEVEAGGKIRMGIGASDAPFWAEATLYGRGREVLASKRIALDPKTRSFELLSFDYKDSYPDAVRLQVFYFRDGLSTQYERMYSRIRTRLSLPLKASSFRNSAYPGTEYTFVWKTDPEVEAVAAIFDKSIDAIAPNPWQIVHLRDFSVPYVSVSSCCGRVGAHLPIMRYAAAGARMKGSADMLVMEEMAPLPVEKAVAMNTADSAAQDEAAEVPVREQFEAALAFEPHLVSGKDGNLSLTFRTSDKLSTYYVALYAHDKTMRNAQFRDEMVVSIPVKVSMVTPTYLYDGDSYDAAVTVSSNAQVPVKGKLCFYVYPSGEWKGVQPRSVQQKEVTVPAGGVISASFNVKASGEALGVKAVFVGDEFSDAVFVPIPVHPAEQTLTEAHSAVWRAGMDKEAVLKSLRSSFVNVSGSKAELTERSIIDMVREAIPTKVVPDGKDVLSLSEAWYVRKMAGRIGQVEPEKEDLLPKILACRNADGGFGWFEGMHSSPIITAVLLERFAKLRDRGFAVPEMAQTVAWLDRCQFNQVRPFWWGWVSDAQYMYVRSLYPGVPFEVKPETKEQKERMSEFKKDAKKYLVPSRERGLKGQILAKARRIRTLMQLSGSPEGIALAKAWGVTVAAKEKMLKSLNADILSLVEYAVEHKHGGWYYPNAVMPWRGLLETEAYAHSLLCDLLSEVNHPEIADGIRIWLMLQKETQKWDEEPAFVDALTSILDGSEEVLSTKVLVLSATYTKPFPKIKAAGNGFKISREFYRDGVALKPGDPVNVGDKILVKYVIWNEENRSFVKLNAAREASLRPVDQLSGHTGWAFRPMCYGSWSFSPQGYRNVKTDRTEYYFDSYPEETTTQTEELFVTQAGSFTAPVVTIESLYAPHYRANDGFHGVLTSR